MHQLLLLRHAKSSRKDQTLDDFDRPLAKRGRNDCKLMGRWLAENGPEPDLIISSTAVRAKDTTRRICKRIDYDFNAVQWEDALYGANMRTVLKLLAKVDELTGNVMLVGHHEALNAIILGLSDWSAIPADPKLIPTGALARFDVSSKWSGIKDGKAVLRSITKPRELVASMA